MIDRLARARRPLIYAGHGVALSEASAELTALANKFVSGGGGDGKSFPDLFTQGAISDCQKGNYAKGIPVLEKRLRSSRVTLPSR